MKIEVKKVLEGECENHLLPFMWVQNGHRDSIPEQIETIYQSGARAFCVESRTHQFFCEEEWWEDMALILSEAEKRGMKVWLLDDKHFPTGYANGLIEKKYPERRKWHLVERHVDAIGPMKDACFLFDKGSEENILLGIFLYRRTGNGEEISGEPISLSAQVRENFVFVDIPEGSWRIFYYYQTRRGSDPHQKNYIHMIDPESVAVQLEAVYEPHYQYFGKYFGTTFAGFFSDEPCLGNSFFNSNFTRPEIKHLQIGLPGLALPWTKKLLENLDRAFGKPALPYLAGLWYPYEGISEELRYHYMDEMTKLYREAFCGQLGDWCRAHQVEYIGHIIEDMNAHARLGCSAGHYFRSLDGQDMSGMDIVLHQVMPGFAEYQGNAFGSIGVVDTTFYHYALAQMCASMARLNPRMKGRALCEVFGAYGWAEGAPMMKWLIDHLLVRGINYFVPHAFSPVYPNEDCPPHFYAEGNDPQFEGFQTLMKYVNEMATLFDGSKSTARTAVLYHAESEWANGDDSMLMQVPGKVLTDAHIAFEYLPLDYIREYGQQKEGALCVNEICFTCILVPYARYFPADVRKDLDRLYQGDVAVYMVCEEKTESNLNVPKIRVKEIISILEKEGIPEIRMEPESPLVRISHWKQGTRDLYMLFNEGMESAANLKVQLANRGDYLFADILNGEIYRGTTQDGIICCDLMPYESKVLIFDRELPVYPTRPEWREKEVPAITWQVSLCELGKTSEFKEFGTMKTPENITKLCPNFSGIIRYEGTFVWDGEGKAALDLGEVGETAHLWINGKDCGIRISKPYFFEVTEAIQKGENKIRIEVANTLVHRVQDGFSTFMAIPPSGLTTPITFFQ
ncbi:MAG: glycosylhydrolase-like jelly roll fold domain-containing protein [Candidatus Merdivicinus sp.]|jgi:hypothetical protein